MIDKIQQLRNAVARRCREWRLKNPERSKEIRRRYRQNIKKDPIRLAHHREKEREYNKTYRRKFTKNAKAPNDELQAEIDAFYAAKSTI